jgi:hypothetical protein
MKTKTLDQIASQHPFPDYADWWVMGKDFIGFMSGAIIPEWQKISRQDRDFSPVQAFVSEYIRTVYKREASSALVDRFHRQDFSQPFYSGEFDALSYAFYRAAFEVLADTTTGHGTALARGRRNFAVRVGERFFTTLAGHLHLNLPSALKTDVDFSLLGENIQTIGSFLVAQGYLRDHFAFRFDLDITHTGRHIEQDAGDFLSGLRQNGIAYALYEMGYPAILPSAVYLYHTHGEAQHHSSRTIEELFDRLGCRARETDDFDPTGFPSDKVVELWEIRML